MVRPAALIVTALCLCGFQSDRWVPVSSNSTGSVYYIDAPTLRLNYANPHDLGTG